MAKKTAIPLEEPLLARGLGLDRVYIPTAALTRLITTTGSLQPDDKRLLEQVRNELVENADSWNEEELKMQFISMLMFLAHFERPIRTYYDREISATIDNNYIKCEADMLLAQGFGELIEIPYFFLHDDPPLRYKREKKYAGDPVGQMLAGMLVGQAKNNNGKPMYGCYVQGRFWFFSVLEGRQYVVNRSFDATDEAVAEQIVLILRNLKQIILTELISKV